MFDVTLTKMATFEKNKTMSIAMNNHSLFISGQGGRSTGKHVLLRNKPKVNAFFTPIGRIPEFVILSISAIQEHLAFYPGPLVLQSKRLIQLQ